MENLISMLRELDLEKNDKDTIKYVLNYVADELEKESKKSIVDEFIRSQLENMQDTLYNDTDYYSEEDIETIGNYRITDDDIDNVNYDDSWWEALDSSLRYFLIRSMGVDE